MQHARCVSIPDTTLIAVAAMPRVLHVMDRNFHRRTDAIDRSGESHLKMASLSLPSGLSALWHSVRHQIIGLNRWADNVFVITDSSKSCWLVDLTYPSKTFGRTVLDVSVSRHSSTLVSGQDHNTFNDEIVEIATKRPRLTPENTVSTKESNCAKIYKIQANALRKIDIENGWTILATFHGGVVLQADDSCHTKLAFRTWQQMNISNDTTTTHDIPNDSAIVAADALTISAHLIDILFIIIIYY
ncbi:hypothetical protein BASA62_002076 [Batrachochytrium salamandrivorans]|nr:hypothetical protein BASA62_002076 [Batrachochytrium salamandrivorans]